MLLWCIIMRMNGGMVLRRMKNQFHFIFVRTYQFFNDSSHNKNTSQYFKYVDLNMIRWWCRQGIQFLGQSNFHLKATHHLWRKKILRHQISGNYFQLSLLFEQVAKGGDSVSHLAEYAFSVLSYLFSWNSKYEQFSTEWNQTGKFCDKTRMLTTLNAFHLIHHKPKRSWMFRNWL